MAAASESFQCFQWTPCWSSISCPNHWSTTDTTNHQMLFSSSSSSSLTPRYCICFYFSGWCINACPPVLWLDLCVINNWDGTGSCLQQCKCTSGMEEQIPRRHALKGKFSLHCMQLLFAHNYRQRAIWGISAHFLLPKITSKYPFIPSKWVCCKCSSE